MMPFPCFWTLWAQDLFVPRVRSKNKDPHPFVMLTYKHTGRGVWRGMIHIILMSEINSSWPGEGEGEGGEELVNKAPLLCPLHFYREQERPLVRILLWLKNYLFKIRNPSAGE